jgi:hypothetical protein
MAVLDSLYHGYGDEGGPSSPCAQGSTNAYCNGVGADCKGVNTDFFPRLGNKYLDRHFPLLDRVQAISIRTISCTSKDGCLKPLMMT